MEIGFLLGVLLVSGQVPPLSKSPNEGALRTLLDTNEIWEMSNEERAQAYRISVEGRVNFYDPDWGNLWFDHGGAGRYLRVSRNAPKLVNGQRVRLEGTLVPAEGLSGDRLTVTVLSESDLIEALSTRGRISEIKAFDRRVVATEGYVDEVQLIDAYHLRLTMIVENRRVICWVPPDSVTALPDLMRRFVRVTAVYSGRIDPTGTEVTVELWAARENDIEVLGSIANAEQFNLPVTPTGTLNTIPVGSMVRLQGQLRDRDVGASFIVRDNSGEVLVECLQRETINRGAEVEVVGHTAISSSRWIVRDAMFRRSTSSGDSGKPAHSDLLDRVDHIRELSPEVAATGKPVNLSGLVTWSLPEADFFFLQDLSGGVRVRLPAGMPAPPLQKWLRVEGQTAAGAFAPVVDLRQFVDLGALAHPHAKRITYAQAISGGEDGQWVEMRGFIRRTASEGDWRWIYVTTPDGEFVGHLQSPVNFVATPGSLLRVRGVCEVTTDANNRINGVRLRIPYLHDITVEEDAPAEVYDLPVRTVADLRHTGGRGDMARVHIRGEVLHHAPGQSLIVQEGERSVMAFSREPGQLQPGDTVDVVGILGQEGARVVLREATFRHTGEATAPVPQVLEQPAVLDSRQDMRLVKIEGTLLDFSRHAERLHLALLSGNSVFDATLDHPPGASPEIGLTPGMVLAVVGIYQIAYDDFARPRGFDLRIRSERDLAVVAPARFWTVSRALVVAGSLAGCTLLGVIWLVALRTRVRTQTAQIRQQLQKQANLEAELERAQRFRSLGLLAGGLAHDFNNLLTGILGNVTLAMLDERAMPLVGDSLRDIEASAKRASDLTQQLVTFAKGGDPMRDDVMLPDLLQRAGEFALSGSKARANVEVASGLWPVHADGNQLGRALQNLLLHARGSMPDGGVVQVRAANEVVVGGGRSLAAGRYVRLTIVDQGKGIAAEQLPGFFDPYSATKFGDDRFSLAIAYSIIKRHGGHIEVKSNLGQGTEFVLWVPAATGTPKPHPATATSDLGSTVVAGTRVLLMDDEETIRRLAERLLQRMGCDARTVPDGEACVEAYREAMAAGRRFQIVILDLTVAGGMGGRECLEALLRIDPHVRAIVSSGYSNDPVMANYREHGFRAVVPKPYAVSVLADCICNVLGAPK